MVAYVLDENKAIWKSFQQLTLIESFPKIYSCMGVTWVCLEVLTEIYDLAEIIRRTSKLIR